MFLMAATQKMHPCFVLSSILVLLLHLETSETAFVASVPSSSSSSVTRAIESESKKQFDELVEYFAYVQQPPPQGDPPPASRGAASAAPPVPPVDVELLSTADRVSRRIRDDFDSVLFDCDGVLYRGTALIPGAAEAVQNLLSWTGGGDDGQGRGRKKKKVLFITNNAGQSRAELRDKLARMLCCPQLTEDQMISSSYSCAKFLQRQLQPSLPGKKSGEATDSDASPLRQTMTKTVYVIGTQGLKDEIRKFGFRVVGGPEEHGVDDDDRAGMNREELASHDFDRYGGDDGGGGDVHAVVVGLDTDFNYRKLCVATGLLQRNPSALLVATNRDAFDLVGADARRLPGNGSIVRSLETSSGRTAVNVGKPSEVLAELVRDEHGLDPARTVVVGDRLDTDVRFGNDGGMCSALVMTGCTTADQLIRVLERRRQDGCRGDEQEGESFPKIVFPHMGMMC